jgi:hypothetical protein
MVIFEMRFVGAGFKPAPAKRILKITMHKTLKLTALGTS